MNKLSISINTAIYSKEALIAATYNYTSEYFVELSEDPNKASTIVVNLEKKDGKDMRETFEKDFLNALIDQQLRQDLNKQFGHIRDLIVEEAFKPVNK